MARYLVRHGGLMRCCLASIDEEMQRRIDDEEGPKEGDTLACKYCKAENGGMIFRDGAWEWNRPEEP